MSKIFYQPVLTEEEMLEDNFSSFFVYREFDNARADYPDKQIAAYKEGDIEDPTFIDDEDDRTTTYMVDIPNSDSDEWIHIESFKTEKEAIDLAMKRFGADEHGMVSLISKS